MVEIYEDKLETMPTKMSWNDLMTPEQAKRGQYYAEEYRLRKGEIDKHRTEWQSIWKLLQCDRDKDPKDPKAPCNFVPLLTPAVEGQTAAMVESDVEFNYVTSNPAHEEYAKQLNAPSKYNRRKSKFMLHVKDMVREYLSLGNAWISVAWEKNFSAGPGKPNGYARFRTPSLVNVFVDGRIKDYKDLQYAEYIIEEIGFMSIDYARKKYGDKYADALSMGPSDPVSEDAEQSYDDTKGWTLLHVWTRNNDYENLQLIEMDENGLILEESPPEKPYYENVDNEYPYWFARGIPLAGCFYGFGDGKILMRFQETINCLFDEMEYGARYSSQGKIAIDPAGEVAPDQLNSDPSKPIICVNPNSNLMQLRGIGVDSNIYNMANMLFEQSQKAIRFSEIMTGVMPTASATATQINGQLMQGAVGIRDKKSDIAQAMAWADRYALKLCLEKWDKSFWVSDGDTKTYFDPANLRKVQQTIGRTDAGAKSLLDKKLEKNEQISPENVPIWEAATEENGDPIMVSLDFDVDVVFGNPMPQGKNDMYNIILGLMQLSVIDEETGQPMPFLKTKRARKLLEEFLGIKLTDNEAEAQNLDKASLTSQLEAMQLNPLGENNTVQTPQGAEMPAQAQEQMANVPGTPGMDLRGMQVR